MIKPHELYSISFSIILKSKYFLNQFKIIKSSNLDSHVTFIFQTDFFCLFVCYNKLILNYKNLISNNYGNKKYICIFN